MSTITLYTLDLVFPLLHLSNCQVGTVPNTEIVIKIVRKHLLLLKTDKDGKGTIDGMLNPLEFLLAIDFGSLYKEIKIAK